MDPLPDFLQQYLKRNPDGTISYLPSLRYSLSIVNHRTMDIYRDGRAKQNAFRDVYLASKKIAELNFKMAGGVFRGKTLDGISEEGFMNLNVQQDDYFTIDLIMDMPFYWFDKETGLIGRSFIAEACELSFYSLSMEAGASPLVMVFTFECNLFTRHIRKYINETMSFEPYYFEPAAKLNRLVLRNLFFELRRQFPDLDTLEFSTPKLETKYKDEYGLLDGADVFDLDKKQ